MGAIRRYLISGLFFWLPILVTFLVFRFLFNLTDGLLRLLPGRYQPDYFLGYHIPGLGIIFTLLVLFFTGMLVANFIGKRLVVLWDGLMSRIPLVRSIYNGVQQILKTIMTPGGKAFRRVVLVEYPRKGMWSVAFQTGDGSPEVNSRTHTDLMTIFIPTTPNPTSGFLMVVPQKDVLELDMTVDQALKFIISLGVMQPENVEKWLK